MKVLQLGKFYPVRGGVEKVMYDIMTGLASRGIDCDMMCAELSGHGAINRVSEHSRLITCRTWVKAASTTISPSMPVYLRRIASDYDIIHVHHPDPMAALALYMSGYRGKVVLHWHSDIVKQRRLVRLYAPLQSWLLRRADVVIGTTDDYIQESPFLAPVLDKTVCVPIGVEPMKPDYAGATEIRNRYPGKTIVFFLGRLIGYKGVDQLVEAASKLPDNYVVLIGGSGPLRDQLESQILTLGLGHKVHMLGRIPDESLPAYYTACHLFCLPSVMKTEAFGVVQIEAMSLGKPIVATRIPGSGVSWVNAHKQSGLNVPVRDAEALAKAILEITKSHEKYSQYCDGAESRYHSLFTLDSMIANCEKIYRLLLEKSHL
ncbi:MAG: glycosyltransferase [Paramuribaculum sp.]|nr:glycosyltransferase [Paramuribaculum sp.]